MGLLGSLFGGAQSGDRQLAKSLTSMISMSTALIPIEREMNFSPARKRATVGFIFGFVDFMGQSKGLSPDMVLETAKQVFKQSFNLSPKQVAEMIDIATECSRSETGRKYIMKGADAMAAFMAKKKNIPIGNNEFMMLMCEAENDALLGG